MRTPLYETSVGALAALLNSETAAMVLDLYTITLASGAVLRWSGSDGPVGIPGTTWFLGPAITRSRIRTTIGIGVDRLELKLSNDGSYTINGVPLLQYIATGGFRGARVRVDRGYVAPAAVVITGVLSWFTGRVADVTGDRTEMRLVVKSELELLDVMVPRELYQPGCLNTLYDPACGANRAAFAVSGVTTGAGNAARTTFPTNLVQAAGYFDLGVITFTSGPNTGISRTVRSYASGNVFVLGPFPAAVASGHTFTIVPGCNKSKNDSNGCPKFFSAADVQLRFRGHPYIPVPETVI